MEILVTLLVFCTLFEITHGLNRPFPSNSQHRLINQGRSCSTALRHHVPRREFLSLSGVASACLLGPFKSVAEETVVDSSMSIFNPDGSLKQNVDTEAKFRTVSFDWDPSDSYLINVDGNNIPSTPSGSKIRVSYQLPEKWINGEGSKYFDPSEKAKACERILVYQARGTVSVDRLEQASTIGIAKALDITDDLQQPLYSSDLVFGRTTKKQDRRYFEFDCAVAPKTCSASIEDLGLGFCPYDTIYLLSATEVDGKLYVMVIESEKTEWKRANSDLKRVRSTFTVESNSRP